MASLHPPPTAFVLSPLAFLPLPWAFRLWTIVQGSALVWLIPRCSPEEARPARVEAGDRSFRQELVPKHEASPWGSTSVFAGHRYTSISPAAQLACIRPGTRLTVGRGLIVSTRIGTVSRG
jgi:hypothetical protein